MYFTKFISRSSWELKIVALSHPTLLAIKSHRRSVAGCFHYSSIPNLFSFTRSSFDSLQSYSPFSYGLYLKACISFFNRHLLNEIVLTFFEKKGLELLCTPYKRSCKNSLSRFIPSKAFAPSKSRVIKNALWPSEYSPSSLTLAKTHS